MSVSLNWIDSVTKPNSAGGRDRRPLCADHPPGVAPGNGGAVPAGRPVRAQRGRAVRRALERVRPFAWGLAVVAAVVTGCRAGGRSSPDRPSDDETGTARAGAAAASGSVAGSTAISPQVAAPLESRPPARDADQRFLRDLADHYECLRAVVHDEMSSPAAHAAHGTSADAGDIDLVLDNEQRAIVALLDTLYGDAYSPRPQLAPPAADAAPRGCARPSPSRASAPGASGAGDAAAHPNAGGEPSTTAFRVLLGADVEAGMRFVEASTRTLRRAQTRALAARLHESQHALRTSLAALSGAPDAHRR